jgi:hypothetical protein
MTPSELRGYLRERREASLLDLACHFETDAEVVKDVLAYWQRKGKIVHVAAGAACGKACARQCAGTEFYRWQETEQHA